MNESIRERLLDDVAAVIEEVEALLETGADSTGDSLRKAQKTARERLSSVKDSLARLGGNVSGDIRQRAAATDRYVRENPWWSLGAAAALAFMLGCLVSRRD